MGNVAALVDAPKVTRSDMRALDAEEARQLMRVADGDRLEALLIVALSTGMQSGEMLGLTWWAITPTGAPLDGRDIIRSWFRRLLAKAGLPPIRMHDLRHSHASIALALGVHPKVIQEALGHSTIAVTLDLYSPVVPSLQREAAKEMAEALFS